MSAEISAAGAARAALGDDIAISARVSWLRLVIAATGVLVSILFVVVGLSYQLQLYADGSIFSYAVAVRDAWAFHWHNISGRAFVYLYAYVPAEAYGALTGNARGAVNLYGFLFFASPLLGLGLTFAADRSQGRTLFTVACLSVAGLCPLMFGYPSELWVSHALFWPTLALCHYARPNFGGAVSVVLALTALVLTHEGAVIFAAAIVCTLALRGLRDPAFRRAVVAFVVAMAVWAAVKAVFRPSSNFSNIVVTLAFNAVDPTSLACEAFLLLAGALALYGIAFLTLRRFTPSHAHLAAVALVAGALAVHWLWFDGELHTDDRYYLRTALIMATPILGALAAWQAVVAEGKLGLRLPFVPQLIATLRHHLTAPAIAGALALAMLVHVVETTKFVAAWTDYRAAVAALATGTAADPKLGDPSFVSSARIGESLNRLAWSSTTPYLSVLVAPGFAPRRLVVDPTANYFWISCAVAAANHEADRAIPAESRRLIEVHACLKR
jgi:hypothetical protein